MFTMTAVRAMLVRAGVLAGLAALAACGGGGGGGMPSSSGTQTDSCSASSCGTVFMAMTDADGDFMSYTVDVVSLTLKRANGATVETLPATTRVDFAQYVDLTEFLTAATIL